MLGHVKSCMEKTNGDNKLEAFSEWLDDSDFGDLVSHETETVYA